MPTTTSVTGVANNLDGTYTVTCDATVNVTANGTLETSVLIFSPALGRWTATLTRGVTSSLSFDLDCEFFADDGTMFVILDQPIDMTVTNPFNVAQGFLPIM